MPKAKLHPEPFLVAFQRVSYSVCFTASTTSAESIIPTIRSSVAIQATWTVKYQSRQADLK